MKDKWPYVMLAMTVIGVVVVGGFFVFQGLIGGSASLGYQENGHWFVGQHGVYTEVGEALWQISYIWEIVFMLFFPAYVIVACIYANIEE